MPKEEDFERENSAVKEAFNKRKGSIEDQAEHAERLLKNHLKQALGEMGSDKRKSVARDIIKISQGEPSKFRGGESGANIRGIPDEPLPTGFEPKPWEDLDD